MDSQKDNSAGLPLKRGESGVNPDAVPQRAQCPAYAGPERCWTCSVVCSIFEELIVRPIISFISLNKAFDRNQHGFVAHRSTCTQLLHMTKDWTVNGRVHKCTRSFPLHTFQSKIRFRSSSSRPFVSQTHYSRDTWGTQLIVNWCWNHLHDRHCVVGVGYEFGQPSAAPTGFPQGSSHIRCSHIS